MAAAAKPAKPAPQESLDKLQTQVGSVLFQLGNIFKHAHQGDKKALERAKAKAAKGIPTAHNVFQEAIDELERELSKARAVIDSDLHQLREKRAAREKAADAARMQAANGTPANIKKEPGLADAAPGLDINGAAAGHSAEEVAATAAAAASIPDDLDALFADDFGAVGSADAQGGIGGPQTVTDDADMSDLFGDGMGFDGEFGMNADASGDGITNLLPGLEKYVNQGQDNAAAGASTNGQPAAGTVDDIDLDKLLDGITDPSNGDTGLSSGTGAQGSKSDQNSGGAKTDGKDNKPNGATQEQKKAEEPAPSTSVDDSMEFTFDFMDDGGVMGQTEDIDSWLDFGDN